MSKQPVNPSLNNPPVEDRRQHAKGGSLTNMPTPEQMKHFKEVDLPKIHQGIRKAWAENQRKVRALNGRVRFVDQG